MLDRYASFKYCKNHPDKLAIPHRNVCKECFNESQRKTWDKYKDKYNSRLRKKNKDSETKNKYSDYGFMFKKVG